MLLFNSKEDYLNKPLKKMDSVTPAELAIPLTVLFSQYILHVKVKILFFFV